MPRCSPCTVLPPRGCSQTGEPGLCELVCGRYESVQRRGCSRGAAGLKPPTPPSRSQRCRIKCEVGRPRPHFRNRCWPGGAQPVFSPDGLPKCADAAVDPAEGIKVSAAGAAAARAWLCAGMAGACRGSARCRPPTCVKCPSHHLPALQSFPSGHTAWSTSGLAYTSLWLLGKLRVFGGQQAQPARFLLALSPLLGALWIGMSRMQDYWHHWCARRGLWRCRTRCRLTPIALRGQQVPRVVASLPTHPSAPPPALPREDVTCGFLLGLLMAWAHYRQVYPSVLSDQAGVLMAAVRGGSSNGRLAVPASRLQLLYQGSQGELKGLEEAAAADDKV